MMKNIKKFIFVFLAVLTITGNLFPQVTFASDENLDTNHLIETSIKFDDEIDIMFNVPEHLFSEFAEEDLVELVSDKKVEDGEVVTLVEIEGSLALRFEMDPLDVIVAGAIHLSSEIDEEDMLSDEAYPKEIIPLHDFEGSVIAYYITFTSDSYAVVNNNRLNPTVLEFGEGENPFIREILDTATHPFIVYNDPFDVFNKNIFERSTVYEGEELIENHPDLLEEDLVAIEFHSQVRDLLVEANEANPQVNFVRGKDSNWGFVTASGLPSGTYTSKTLKNLPANFAVMSSFSNNTTKNHCGATAVTNLALIFGQRSGNSKLIVNGKINDTFRTIHPKYVKNGPITTIADKAKDYFKARGVSTLKSTSVGTVSGYRNQIDKERPVGVLLQKGSEAHWVVGVGYRKYGSTTYFRIVTGWANSTNRYYKPGSGSLWVSGSAYYQ